MVVMGEEEKGQRPGTSLWNKFVLSTLLPDTTGFDTGSPAFLTGIVPPRQAQKLVASVWEAGQNGRAELVSHTLPRQSVCQKHALLLPTPAIARLSQPCEAPGVCRAGSGG